MTNFNEITLRSTSIGSYHKCPMAWAIDNYQPFERTSSSFAATCGTTIHKFCEEYILHRNFDRAVATAFLEYKWREHRFRKRKTYVRSPAQLYETCEKLVDSGYLDLDFLSYKDKKMLEFTFKANVKTPFNRKYTLRGTMDGVIMDRTYNKVSVLDWKTSVSKSNGEFNTWKNRQQFVLYSYILKYIMNYNYPALVNVIAITWSTDNIDIKRLPITFTEEQHNGMLRHLSKLFITMERDIQLNSFDKCDNCINTYGDVCRFEASCSVAQTPQEINELHAQSYIHAIDTSYEYDIEIDIDLTDSIDYLLNYNLKEVGNVRQA